MGFVFTVYPPSPGLRPFVHSYVGFAPLGPDAAERMLRDGFPRQFLQEAVQVSLVVAELGLLEDTGHTQSHRAAAIDHGVVAIADQGLEGGFAVAEFIAEQVLLGFQPGRLAREVVEVGPFVVGQPQGTGDRREHLPRRPWSPALLETDVVIHGHAGQLRDLLPAQARCAPPLPGLQPDVGRLHPRAPPPQEGGQFGPVELAHPLSVTSRGAPPP